MRDLKFQTREQLVLQMLLDWANEELELSEQRRGHFIDDNDLETLEAENEMNKVYRDKVSKIESLIEMEKGCRSSAICVVTTGYVFENGEVGSKEVYESKII